MREARREILFKIILLSGSIMLSFVVLEVILRMVSPPSVFSPLLPLHPRNKMELHVNLGGLSPKAIHSTNKWGLRGDEPPSEWKQYYTIVTIGGSTTLCFYLDDHKTWPYLLQEKLKDKYPHVWVGNGGLDGQSTQAHIIFMEEVITKIKPDAVILLVGYNDLGFSIRDDRRLYGNPSDKSSWKMKIYGNSRLLQTLYTWKLIIFDDAIVVKKSVSGNYEPKPLTGDPMPLPEDLKSLLPGLDGYRENLKKIIRMGNSMDVRVILLTQPMLFDDTEYWRGVEGGFYGIRKMRGKMSAATIWNFLNIYNKELMKTCGIENVECFDLASAIPHEDLYFYDTVHFTERGAELVAEKVAEFLKGSDKA